MSEYREAEQLKIEGMERVHANAGDAFAQAARRVGAALARHQPFFTACDLIDAMPEGVTAHDDRALGAVMTRLARDGVIEKTDRVQKSRRKRNHNRPVAVWRSLFWRDER